MIQIVASDSLECCRDATSCSEDILCATSVDVHPQDIYFCSSSEKYIKCGTPLKSWHCWRTIYELFKKGVSV